MNLSVLLEQYQRNPRLLQLADRLGFVDTQRLYLKNLQGSSIEFVIAALFSHDKTKGLNHLVVVNDAEEAAYLHNTIENLTSAFVLLWSPYRVSALAKGPRHSNNKNSKCILNVSYSSPWFVTQRTTTLVLHPKRMIFNCWPAGIGSSEPRTWTI